MRLAVGGIARRRYNQHVVIVGILERIVLHGAGVAAAQAGVYDVRAVVHGPPDTPRQHLVGTAAVLPAKHLHGQYLRAPGDAGYTRAVVALRRRDTRRHRAVTQVVRGVTVVVVEVVTGQDLARQIGVVGCRARVDEGDHDIWRASGDVPGLFGVNLRHTPLLARRI